MERKHTPSSFSLANVLPTEKSLRALATREESQGGGLKTVTIGKIRKQAKDTVGQSQTLKA